MLPGAGCYLAPDRYIIMLFTLLHDCIHYLSFPSFSFTTFTPLSSFLSLYPILFLPPSFSPSLIPSVCHMYDLSPCTMYLFKRRIISLALFSQFCFVVHVCRFVNGYGQPMRGTLSWKRSSCLLTRR